MVHFKNHKYMTLPCAVNLAEFHAGEYPTTFANHAEIVFDAQYLPEERMRTDWAAA